MNELPGDLLDEAAKLFESLRRRWDEAQGRAVEDDRDGDVWSRAVTEPPGEPDRPRIATGAPECRDCPICRAIAMTRESGGDVRTHLREAGRSLLAAARDVVAAYDRTRPRGPGAGGPMDIG
jgi:hypothetical protein